MRLGAARVLVTGATGGIGQAIAVAVAASGAEVVLTGRRMDVLEPLAERLGGRAIAADLADRADVADLVAKAGEVDVVVANAALPGSGDLMEYGVAEIDRALEVNLRSQVVLARLMVEQFLARDVHDKGHIVFINSLSGKSASPHTSLYNATKFGLRGFALALREELRGQGIGISTVYPGFIRDAGMFADAQVALPPGVGPAPRRTSREPWSEPSSTTSARSMSPRPAFVSARS